MTSLQAALNAWVHEYNTAWPHQSCGARPPVERFRLADRSIIPDNCAAAPVPAPVVSGTPVKRPAGRSRWVNVHGKIWLAGFSYNVGGTYAGEPVEVVVALTPQGPSWSPSLRSASRVAEDTTSV